MSQSLRKASVWIGAIAFALTAPVSAWAIPISGELAYGGTARISDGTLEFIYAVAIGTGDLATLSQLDHAPIVIPGPGGALIASGPLWTDVGHTQNYFTLQAAARSDYGSGSTTLTGAGVMSLGGFDDTAYDWNLSFDATAGAFFFSAAQTSVPEPGTLALLGIGLAAMRLSRRRKIS